MRYTILALLVLVVACHFEGYNYFRFKTIEGDWSTSIEGTILTRNSFAETPAVLILALTPEGDFLTITGLPKNLDSAGPIQKYSCGKGFRGRNYTEFDGSFELQIVEQKIKSSGCCCNSFREKDRVCYSFQGNGIKAQRLRYPGQEAGLRAKKLLRKSIEAYRAYETIGYALSEIPYFFLSSCRDFLDKRFPDYGFTYGAILVGKDGEHCGIIDNEGTKFTYS